ncbi:MAG: hypothetical protein RRY79_01680 [Clostridia bacterium]
MKTNFFKSSALILSLILILSVLSACAGGTTTPTASQNSGKPTAKTLLTLKIGTAKNEIAPDNDRYDAATTTLVWVSDNESEFLINDANAKQYLHFKAGVVTRAIPYTEETHSKVYSELITEFSLPGSEVRFSEEPIKEGDKTIGIVVKDTTKNNSPEWVFSSKELEDAQPKPPKFLHSDSEKNLYGFSNSEPEPTVFYLQKWWTGSNKKLESISYTVNDFMKTLGIDGYDSASAGSWLFGGFCFNAQANVAYMLIITKAEAQIVRIDI